MSLTINSKFAEVLDPLGEEAANFFLAAALYHAHKLSFAAAAALAGLSTEDFAARLHEHFESGYAIASEVISEDLAVAKELACR